MEIPVSYRAVTENQLRVINALQGHLLANADLRDTETIKVYSQAIKVSTEALAILSETYLERLLDEICDDESDSDEDEFQRI